MQQNIGREDIDGLKLVKRIRFIKKTLYVEPEFRLSEVKRMLYLAEVHSVAVRRHFEKVSVK
jgi:hypothetical protein